MPFTLSHPAAALLLRWTRLPVAAVVVGSMVPDIPLFLRDFGTPYGFTHSIRGAVSVDLAASLVLLGLWIWLLRDALADLAPSGVRERLPASERYDVRQWLLAVPAAVLGSLTHIVWDAFTHEGRWGAARVTWLHEDHGQHPGAQWAQYASSVIGLGICAAWALVALRSRPRRPRPPRVRWLQPVAVALLCVGAAAAVIIGVQHGGGLRVRIGLVAVVGTIDLVTVLVAVSLLWQVAVRRGGRAVLIEAGRRRG